MTTARIASPALSTKKSKRRRKIAIFEPYVFDTLYGNARYISMYFKFIDKARFHPLLISPVECDYLETLGTRDEQWRVIPGLGPLNEFGGKTLAGGPVDKAVTLLCLLWYTLRLAICFIRERVDIVQCHHIRALLTAGFAAKLTRRPLIWYVKGELQNPKLDRFCFMLADRILFQGETNLRRRYSDLIEKYRHKLGILENGVDLDDIAGAEKRDHGSLIRELDIDRCKTNIVFVGQVMRAKGLDELIAAMSQVQKEYRDTALYVVGDHCIDAHIHYRAELDDAIRKYGLMNVTFTGWRSDAHDIISVMDIFVLPSHSEGVPQTVMEAMAFGKPVLTTEVGSIADIVNDEETGLLVPAKNSEALAAALRRLVGDLSLRDRLGKQGREAVYQNQSIKKGIQGFERLYQSLC